MTLRDSIVVLLSLVISTFTPPAFAFEPAANAITTPEPTFVWADDDQFASYRLLFLEAGASIANPTATVDADDPTICPGIGECRLAPASDGYPHFGATEYTWAIRATTRAGETLWWGPNFTAFRMAPGLPDILSVSWAHGEITATWPKVAGVSNYKLSFEHGLFAPAEADVVCNTVTCSLTQNVSYIPYGTVHVSLRSCQPGGTCSPRPRSAEAYQSCPQTPAAPVIIAPAEDGDSSSLVALKFSHVGYAESYQIRINDKNSGLPVVNERVEYTSLACTSGSCTRLYPLPAGTYTLGISASCATATGPVAGISFATDGSKTTPELLAPKLGATTSVYPLVAWKKIFGVDRYEVSFKRSATGVTTSTVALCAEPPICLFDPQQAELAPVEGDVSVTVRIAMQGMVPADAVAFVASYAYRPPEVINLTPAPGTKLPEVPSVAVHFQLDPQVPFMTTDLADATGTTLVTSGRATRLSVCKPRLDGELALVCDLAFPISQSGTHIVSVRASAPSNGGSALTTTTTTSDFDQAAPAAGNAEKATYSIFAQNTQFLPSSPFNGGGSNAYFQSDSSRADLLADFIVRNKFDVVALSEVFTMEAKKRLNKRLLPAYSGVSHIDTTGRWDEFTFGSIAAGYFAGFWLNAQVPGAIAGASKTIQDWTSEANSGLALYTRFKIKEHPGEDWDANSRCTNDEFNEVKEEHPENEPNFKIRDRVWFRQYCHGAGSDNLSAKGFAAAELENPVTGLPLLIAWSHTQAYTTDSNFFELGTGDYSESYEARATQVEDNAGPAIRNLLDKMAPGPFDAFILGDWNIPSPASIARLPSKHAGASAQDDGWADLGKMYAAGSATDDLRNPKLSSLVGDDAPNNRARLFEQYWNYFDPRNTNRPFVGFHDLWLENPAGDPGYSFDPNRNRIAQCHETGEPCHGKTDLDKGGRYDQVLARFHASNAPAAGAGIAQYPGTGARAWGDQKSCVQHVRLARDFGQSDHWGTIIEVGPTAPLCSPNTAKADPHLWRLPETAPVPNDASKDVAAGRHQGNLSYGGANEWFYFSEAGGFDVIAVTKDTTIPALRIDAFDARDISAMIPVADAEQKTNQTISETCPESQKAIASEGHIPLQCATSEKRVTYRSPSPFFMRIRAANADGTLCDTCAGQYEVLFRKRTCKVYWDAVPVGRSLPNTSDRGWFGEGQPRCWFSYELTKSTKDDDPQTLQIGDLFEENQALCQSAGARCSERYDVQFFDAAPAGDAATAPPEPTTEIHPPETFSTGLDGRSIATGDRWFEPAGPMTEGVMPETGRRKFYALIERSNAETAHAAAFSWTSNLMSVTYNALSVFDIEDDLEIEIEICLPLIGCIIDEPKDPFETEDEISAQIWTNNVGSQALKIDDFGVDYAGGKGAQFPNQAPGGLPDGCKAYQRCYQPDVSDTLVGTTINYTGHSYLHVLESDSLSLTDEVVGDNEMCGVSSGPAPYSTWQSTRFKEQWDAILKGSIEIPNSFMFSDDCPDDDPQFRYRLQVTVPRIE